MNLFKKIALAMIAFSMFACGDLDELLINPNGVDPSQADAVSLYNSVQLNFRNVAYSQTVYEFAGGLTRMDCETGGFTYEATHAPTEFSGFWNDVYADLLPDAQAYLDIAEPLNLKAEVASVKIMKAYTYILLADLFDAVPLSQALQGDAETPNLTPTADSGEEVYNAAIALLDEALVDLDGAGNFGSAAFDNFYGGSAAGWARFAKTLKVRAAVATRLVGGAGGAGTITGFDAAADLIVSNGQNAEWTYGTNRANPNNRHPFYNNSYEVEDGRYQSNWFMWLMAESKVIPGATEEDDETVVDPRIRYYFFRQNLRVFPTLVEDDPNVFDCQSQVSVPTADFIPEHYEAISEDMPFCLGSYSQSYFGRDHLNGSGIPPDGPDRTVYGLYPGGGKFDNRVDNDDVLNAGTDGALGAGIAPIWQASWTHFILAEAALEMGTGGDARALLEDALELSMERVREFENKVDGFEIVQQSPFVITVGDTYEPDSNFTQYIEFVMDEYDAAGSDEDRLGIIAREYLIASFGNGIEGYNLYRRTCLPANMQPGIDPNYGSFIRSALYPAVHVNLNQNISQKPSINEPVFWDTNDASCNY